jgi:ABC-type nitrate/sulfonate/bicarbonate transport system substrate-binding protein
MAKEHPDAPRQLGIRLSNEAIELVSAIQEYRRKSNEPFTLAAIFEDAIDFYYEHLVEQGHIKEE